jgi:hypothetical protein
VNTEESTKLGTKFERVQACIQGRYRHCSQRKSRVFELKIRKKLLQEKEHEKCTGFNWLRAGSVVGFMNVIIEREILGSHGDEYEDICLFGCYTVQSFINSPTYQRSLLPPSSR